jgi:hypothetical protein
MADQAVHLYNRSLEFLTGKGAPKDEEQAFRLNTIPRGSATETPS